MNRAKKKQELIEHYLDFYNVALSMLRNEDDAKDVVQEALVRTLVKVGLRNPAGYCMVAVKHLSVDRLRHRQQLTRIDEMTLVARQVVKRIEEELEYPGQIKVNIVRENRIVDYAK